MDSSSSGSDSSESSDSEDERSLKRRGEKEDEDSPHYITYVDRREVNGDVQPDRRDQPAAPSAQLVCHNDRVISSFFEKMEEAAPLQAPLVFVPYDIRLKRVGQKSYVQVFLPSPPFGWKFTFRGKNQSEIEYTVRREFPISLKNKESLQNPAHPDVGRNGPLEIDVSGLESQTNIRVFTWCSALPDGFEVDPTSWKRWMEPEFIVIQAKKKKNEQEDSIYF